MAYAQGDTILRDHYNIFSTGGADGTANHNVANINTVWGTGNGNKGYGQTTTISAVSAGDTVTATQWATLLARLNSILTHQAGAGSGITSPTAGDTIAYVSTLSGKVTDNFNNRLNFNSTRGATTTGANFDAAFSTSTFTQTITVTFDSADKARYFFNSGGRLSLVFSPSGLTDNAKEQSYTDIMNAVGTLHFDQSTSTRTGSGETLTTDGTTIGYWDLTTSDQTILKLTSDNSTYTGNTLEILLKVAGAAGSNGGLGTQVIFTITYTDGADEAFDDAVSGTFRHRIDTVKPETSNLTDVWGTVTIS